MPNKGGKKDFRAMDPVTLALILSGSIIIIGFIGNRIFERTGFPDMLFLIVLGIILGPMTGLVDSTSIIGFAPYLASLAVVFILFDGGMKMNIYRVFSESPRAAALAIAGFASSVLVVTMLMASIIIPEAPLTYSILFGTILGGNSSIVVVSLTSKIGVSDKCSTVLNLEATLTDILCIVLSLIVIEIILGGSMDLTAISRSITSRFSIGIVLGLFFGLIWLSFMRRTAGSAYAYMLTLAVLLLTYAVSESLGGSGSLSSLLFGITLGNEKEIYQILRMKRPPNMVVNGGLKRFESEIAFLLRTFFFVFIGLIASISNATIVTTGIILSFVLLLVRFGTVTLATIRSELLEERVIMSVTLTRGLAAAVLATIPLQYATPDAISKYGLPAEFFAKLSLIYIDVVAMVILTTAIIASVGIPLLKRKT